MFPNQPAHQADKVVVQACQACADSYGVSDILRKLGIEVCQGDYKVIEKGVLQV